MSSLCALLITTTSCSNSVKQQQQREDGGQNVRKVTYNPVRLRVRRLTSPVSCLLEILAVGAATRHTESTIGATIEGSKLHSTRQKYELVRSCARAHKHAHTHKQI